MFNRKIVTILFLSFFVLGGCSIQTSENIETYSSDVIYENNVEGKYGNLTNSEFQKKLSSVNGDYVLIDIRTVSELKKTGIIDAAINIDFYEADFSNRLSVLDKQKIYLIYCRSGNRTKSALTIMKRLGFDSVYDLDRGINSWDGGVVVFEG